MNDSDMIMKHSHMVIKVVVVEYGQIDARARFLEQILIGIVHTVADKLQ